ncbi:MAG: hypothetical protein R3224_08105 [Balneolaceae bacterium]|nr:hypothetical protein [Balneolaceae bacterium]
MAKKDKNKNAADDNGPEQSEPIDEKISKYEKLLEQLKKERDQIEHELKRDYRNARRYVRSHPEEGVLVSFIGGVVLGILIGKLSK